MKNKIISILLGVVAIAASVAIVYFAAKYNPTAPEATSSILGFSLYAVYSIMAIAFVAMVGFAIWGVLSNFKDSKPALIGMGVLLAVLLVGYLLSASTNSVIEQKFVVSPGLSKLIGGGLLSTYIFGAGAVLAAVWSTISTRFK